MRPRPVSLASRERSPTLRSTSVLRRPSSTVPRAVAILPPRMTTRCVSFPSAVLCDLFPFQTEAVVRTVERDNAKSGVRRAKELADISNEQDMVQNLKKSVVQWGTKKKFKKCQSELEENIEEDDELNQENDEQWETLADSIPVRDDTDADIAAAVEELETDIE